MPSAESGSARRTCAVALAAAPVQVGGAILIFRAVCGRVIQSSSPLNYEVVKGMNVRDSRVHNYPPRWNAAPSQELLVIRRNHRTGAVSLDPLRWGLIPYWCKNPTGGRKPINAKCETVQTLPTFRDAYRLRRCILPVDGFFEWKAIKGQRAKQPFAIAMKDGRPFGIAGLWENWKDPATGEWIRTFAIITSPIDWDWPAELETCQIRIAELEAGIASKSRKYPIFPTEEWMRNSARAFSAK
jgi:putative SOS response-associated peptidase YedK